jgi:CheY-like chemotaxis protein
MTDQTRRNILRYGIAIDLVILATGVGMLAAAPTAPLLIVTYAIAVALSVWRGGWKGGLTALVLSIVALITAFPQANTASNIGAFIALGAIGGTIVALINRPHMGSPIVAPAAEMLAPFTGGPIAVPAEEGALIARHPLETEEDFAQKPLERTNLAEVVPLADEPAVETRATNDTAQGSRKRNRGKRRGNGVSEKRVVLPEPPGAVVDDAMLRDAERAREQELAEAERLRQQQLVEAERVRQQELAEAERVRLQQELEARLSAEREAAQRELEERVAAERRSVEEEAARHRAEAERRAAEAEAERARIEAERRAIEEEATRQRAEAERRAAEAEAERARIEAERRALEEETVRQRAEAERRAAEAEAERARAEAERRAIEEEAARQRAEVEQRAAEAEAERERIAAERRAIEEEATRQRAEAERRAAEAEAERARAENERQLAETERARLSEELEARLAQERETAQKELVERLEAERRTAEDELRRQFEAERQAIRATAEQELAAERERLSRHAEERVAAAHQAAEAVVVAAPKPAPPPPPPPAQKTSLLGTVAGWFRSERPSTSHVNLKTKRVSTNTTATRRPQPSSSAPVRRTTAAAPVATGPVKPRLLLIERRRGTADTIAPKLRHRGVEIEVVERWVDAVDEIFRFKPHALFLDIEHPEFDRMHRTVTEKTTQLPIILTGRAGSTPPEVRRAAFVGRPYDLEEVTRVAQMAATRVQDLLAEQSIPRALLRPAGLTMVAAPTLRGPAHPPKKAAPPVAEVSPTIKPATNDEYEITCFSCRAPFNAVDADWCSCLAKERTLVCTNCLACFCKAPPSYKETFWVEAPPRLFERKTAEARKQGASLPPNPSRTEVMRPLVLTVEDDEEIQAIVQRVCANLGYGFIWATNGQDGLDLAHEYRPEMILSDAFMPKLDGREMCRMLKEEPDYAETKMVVMTGLYTDTKYRSEAVKRFHVDDYVAKPVAITDLINLLQKHLEGVTGLPMQEDLHELHRQSVVPEEGEGEAEVTAADGIPLADILLSGSEMIPVSRPRDSYEVCCFNCQQNFEATRAEWCSCVGRDNTLICEHCHGCFCKAPAAYRERFWIDAPPSLFERKMIGSKRNLGARSNPAPTDVKRPLILLVEDDENVQLIVRTVVSNMGYGFVVGANGQEGLTLAREYDPDLILSDAFMPKLDGREMCRLLKEDPNTSRSKAVIMTGLYTDRKYRNEALDYFKVDDYVAKPLAVDDLIKLFKKHLPQEVTTAH